MGSLYCDFVLTLDKNYLLLIVNDDYYFDYTENIYLNRKIIFNIFDIKQKKIIHKFVPDLKAQSQLKYYLDIKEIDIFQLLQFFDKKLYNKCSNNIIAETKNKQNFKIFVKDNNTFYFFYIDNKYSKYTINQGKTIFLLPFYEQIKDNYYNINYKICNSKGIENPKTIDLIGYNNHYFYYDKNKNNEFLFLFTDDYKEYYSSCNRFILFYK